MIDLLPSDDQLAMIDAVSAVLSDDLPRSRLRALAAKRQPYERALIARAGPLGWLGVTLPEELGGAGLALSDEALLFRELGRGLAPGVFLSTVLAAKVAAVSGDVALARSFTSGQVVAALAERNGDAVAAFDADGADYVIVVDAPRASLRVAELVPGATTQPTIDPLSEVSWLNGTVGAVVASTTSVDDSIMDQGVVLLAAYLCGIAEATRDDSVAYCSSRVQYGRPIGSFQAVKHRCADMAVRSELAWAQTAWASLTVGGAKEGARFAASAARTVAVDAALANTRDNIQNHGGIGYTAEHDAHLFLKRSHIVAQQLGTRELHLERVLTAVRPS